MALSHGHGHGLVVVMPMLVIAIVMAVAKVGASALGPALVGACVRDFLLGLIGVVFGS